jgi:hypothetical protein
MIFVSRRDGPAAGVEPVDETWPRTTWSVERRRQDRPLPDGDVHETRTRDFVE